jgi:flagellar protein FlaG
MSALNPVPPVDPAQPARAPAGDVGAPAAASAPARTEADLRLVIEEDRNSGAFIYKTLDRATGEVVRQFPREEVLRLHADREYEAGTLVKAQA